MHLDVDIPPTSTFYIWLNLERLPAPLNNGLVRFPSILWIAARTDRRSRRSSRSCSRNRRSSSPVSSSTLTPRTAATCSTRLATRSSASRSDPRLRISTKVWTRSSAYSKRRGRRACGCLATRSCFLFLNRIPACYLYFGQLQEEHRRAPQPHLAQHRLKMRACMWKVTQMYLRIWMIGWIGYIVEISKYRM